MFLLGERSEALWWNVVDWSINLEAFSSVKVSRNDGKHWNPNPGDPSDLFFLGGREVDLTILWNFMGEIDRKDGSFGFYT